MESSGTTCKVVPKELVVRYLNRGGRQHRLELYCVWTSGVGGLLYCTVEVHQIRPDVLFGSAITLYNEGSYYVR